MLDHSPSPLGCQSQHRIVWPRPRITRDDACNPSEQDVHSFAAVSEGSLIVNSPSYQLFVGIDVAAATFSACWTSSSPERERPMTLSNTPDGSTRLCQYLLATGVAPAVTLVALEATSTYWVALAVALHTAGFHVAVVNPAQV